MKKENLAFTLIELLIVVGIIAIITGTGVFYWFKQLTTIELSAKTQKIIDIIDNLDSQVHSKEIIDYKIMLDINKHEYWFDYTINTLWLGYVQQLDFDSSLGSWTISSTQLWGTWSFAIKSYEWIKYIWEDVIQAWGILQKMYTAWEDYTITSTLSWQTLNDIFVSYYDIDNLGEDDGNKLELISITEEWANTNYSPIIIENKNWIKSLILNDWTLIESFAMKFEKKWAEHTIIITK